MCSAWLQWKKSQSQHRHATPGPNTDGGTVKVQVTGKRGKGKFWTLALVSEAYYTGSCGIFSLRKCFIPSISQSTQQESGTTSVSQHLSPTCFTAQFSVLRITSGLLKSLEKFTGTIQERAQQLMNISQWSLDLWAKTPLLTQTPTTNCRIQSALRILRSNKIMIVVVLVWLTWIS